MADLDAKAAARVQAAVSAGSISQAQADQLTPKVDDAIVKIVDHKGSPKPAARTASTTSLLSPRPTDHGTVLTAATHPATIASEDHPAVRKWQAGGAMNTGPEQTAITVR